jgi:alkylation response protein AidB-like acyl-CoA dehydrogenase
VTLVIAESLTPDQRLLQDVSAEFIAETMTLSKVRARAFDDAHLAAEYRRGAADLGWFSLLVPEEFGGGRLSDNSVLDACLVAYQRGRLLQPGAFVATNVVARAVATVGSEQQRRATLPGLLTGALSAAWVAEPVPGVIEACRRNDTYRLSGRVRLIEDPGTDGIVLLTASTPDGPTQFLLSTEMPGLGIERVDSLDISRRFVEIHCPETEVPMTAVLGEPGAGAAAAAEQLALACVLLGAESVGAMDYELATTVQYAKDRVAFGRPIGSFQAIKHLLADTSLGLETAKSCVVAAAAHLDAADDYAQQAASIAKAIVGANGQDLVQNCFQVFGGIGFTWEHDQHLYLRRLSSDAALYGDPVWHREYLCQLGGL